MRKPVAGLVAALVCLAPMAAPTSGASASARSDDPHTPGPLTIQSVLNGRVVDVDRGVVQDGRRVQEWTYNGSTAQRWRIRPAGGTHRIEIDANPTYCLGRERGGDLARLVVRPCDGGLADWELQALGGEQYRIKDPAADLFLHVRDEVPTAGRELVTSADGGRGARWYFTDLQLPHRPLPADPRLDQMTFLVAHNAMANSDEGFRWRLPNQSYRLRDQLAHGVRGLQLDVHAYRGEVRMCHGGCWGNERTLTAGLQDVVDFLHGTRSAVVTIFLEDYTSVAELGTAVGRVAGIQDLLFRPDRFGVRDRGWPRMSELLSTNHRLLIFSQRPGREDYGVMYDRHWTAENYWSLGGAGTAVDCYSRWDEVPLSAEEPGFRRLHVMNHYRDIPSERAASTDNGDKLRDRAERICGPSARRKPNYVALDFYQKPDSSTTWNLIRDLNTYW